jgi:hypothetical protein
MFLRVVRAVTWDYYYACAINAPHIYWDALRELRAMLLLVIWHVKMLCFLIPIKVDSDINRCWNKYIGVLYVQSGNVICYKRLRGEIFEELFQRELWNNIFIISLPSRPPLWSSDQSFWLQIQRSRVRFPALPDFLRSSGSGMGSTQPREDNWGATWRKSSCSCLENRD